jgi:hypothetical protein
LPWELHDARHRVRRQRPARQSVGDQALGLGRGEWLEEQGVGVAPSSSPCGTLLDQLGSGQAEQEDRGISPVGDVLDEVEERGLGPVQVFEGEDERARSCQCLEEAANGGEQVVGSAGLLRRSDRDRDLTGDPLAVVLPDELPSAPERPGEAATLTVLGVPTTA